MKARRILMSLGGVIICAFSVGAFKFAALGVDPFQALMSGLHSLIPISFGTLYTLVNLALLLFGLLTDRRSIGIATFLNLFFLGYIAEFSLAMFHHLLPDPAMGLRVTALIGGIVVMCFGSALYMTANLGVSTYDAVAIVLSSKWKIAQFQFCRIGSDLVCVVLGAALFLLAGHGLREVPTIAGVGTIITAFFMGPLIEFFNKTVARPLLNEKQGAQCS